MTSKTVARATEAVPATEAAVTAEEAKVVADSAEAATVAGARVCRSAR